MTRRMLVALIAAVATGLGAGGCATAALTDQRDSAAVSGGPVTVTFWHCEQGRAAEVLDELAVEFSRSTPGVSVEPVYKGDAGELASGLPAAVSAGTAPVLAEVPDEALAELRLTGTIRPLEPFLARRSGGLKAEDIADFWPCFIEMESVGREVWGLPFSHKIYALVYDRRRVDKPPSTWEELRTSASVLTRREQDPAQSVFGLAFRPDTDLFVVFLYQNGGQLFTGDPPRMVFNSPEGTGCLDFLAELATFRKVVLLTMGDPVEAVAAGRAAMAVAPVGWPPDRGPDPAVLAVAPLPAGRTRATLVPGTSLVLVSGHGAAQEKAAWEFLRWLVSPEIAARWAAATGSVPIRRSTLDSPVWQQGPGSFPGLREVLSRQMDAVASLPPSVDLGRLRRELDTSIPPYLLGRVNSSQALLDGVLNRLSRESAGGP